MPLTRLQARLSGWPHLPEPSCHPRSMMNVNPLARQRATMRPPIHLTPRNVLLTAVLGTALAMAGLYARARALDVGWQVGELRSDGLRIMPSGRDDASAALAPSQFADSATRDAYWVAARIPAVLNQLYCWCGCENTGQHRSNLACFEDLMGVDCEVCQGTAEIAYSMVQRGITDPRTIQAAVERRWKRGA